MEQELWDRERVEKKESIAFLVAWESVSAPFAGATHRRPSPVACAALRSVVSRASIHVARYGPSPTATSTAPPVGR
jgi:hypothetical protein